MADVNKIKLPDNSEYNIKDYRIPGIDTTPISGSENLITSGGVHKDIEDASLVVSTALNDLNIRVSEIEGTSSVSQSDYDDDQEVIATALNDLNDRVTIVEDDGIIAEPFSEIDPVSIEYYTKVEIDDLLSDIEETDPIFSASPAANITTSDITSWNNKTNNIGTVTQVKVGTTAYNPLSGVVSLPAYPTTLPASDVSSWAKEETKPTYTAAEVGAQEILVSGENLKTINNESLLGSGNISITGGSGGGGEANVIEAVTFNGTPATITNKTAEIIATIPTIESLTTAEIDTIWNNTL